MKVLLAADGSDYTKRMLAYLAAHDELFARGTGYTVITVVPAIPPHAARFLPSETLPGYYADQAEQVLAPIRRFAAQQGWKVEFVQAAGHAADVIAEKASGGGFDLLMMGSHGHSALRGLVLGSVTSGVLAQCTTPLLIVR
jgi:nucleotide-binding universal stress UspA family protein